ncbi:methionyl-tRNA formyltransferase [Dehalogenimonas sp. THU2]|uniref:methionyl-tRNA formyltransferase n=1 Tax=Dehalogenimonas sp. THU2 TaxID=3151121 RepID=UPI0032188220
MKIVFMGTPEFAVPVLEALAGEGYKVAAVYTRRDAPSGRGKTLTASPVKQMAEQHGLTVIQPGTLRKPEAQAELRELEPDVIVVAAYGLILPQAVLDIPRLGCLNVHASLLPRHRGAAPIAAAIAAGDRFTGVSIMRMDAGIDTGAVYSRAMIPVFDWDTTGSLSGRLAIIGAMSLIDVLPQVERGTIDAVPQPVEGSTYAPMLAKEAGRIDWRQSADMIWRQSRAFQPWPGAYTAWQGKTLKLIETRPVDIDTKAEPGTVVQVPNAPAVPFGVATGGGVLGILSLQLEGKRPAAAAEFLRGQRDFIGSMLG